MMELIMKLFAFLNENSSTVIAVTTIAYTCITLVIVYLMWRSNRINQKQEYERNRARLFFDFVHDEKRFIYAELRNDGHTPAINVKLTFPTRLEEVVSSGKIPFALTMPIPYLSPGKKVRTLISAGREFFGQLDDHKLIIGVNYEDIFCKKHFEKIHHDLTYIKYLVGIDKKDIGEELEKIGKTFTRIERTTSTTSRELDKLVNSPPPLRVSAADTRYSQKALAVARVFVEESYCGMRCDPAPSVRKLVEKTKLTLNDVLEAVDELEEGGFVTLHRELVASDSPRQQVIVEDLLFVEFDRFWMEWDTEEDARRIATDMVSDENFPSGLRNALNIKSQEDRLKQMKQIANRYNWKPRRLNPALCWLEKRKLITLHRAIGIAHYVCFAVDGNFPALRRFVKKHRDEQATKG